MQKFAVEALGLGSFRAGRRSPTPRLALRSLPLSQLKTHHWKNSISMASTRHRWDGKGEPDLVNQILWVAPGLLTGLLASHLAKVDEGLGVLLDMRVGVQTPFLLRGYCSQ